MPLDSHLFDDHMRDPSALTQLLKGHLWVEHCLNRAIEIAVTGREGASPPRIVMVGWPRLKCSAHSLATLGGFSGRELQCPLNLRRCRQGGIPLSTLKDS